MSFERTTSKWLSSHWWNSSIRTSFHLCRQPYVTFVDDTYKSLHYLDLAKMGQEAAVGNFAAALEVGIRDRLPSRCHSSGQKN